MDRKVMKNRILTLTMFLILNITSYAQVTTFFYYGNSSILSSDKKYTAALYSVSIYEST